MACSVGQSREKEEGGMKWSVMNCWVHSCSLQAWSGVASAPYVQVDLGGDPLAGMGVNKSRAEEEDDD